MCTKWEFLFDALHMWGQSSRFGGNCKIWVASRKWLLTNRKRGNSFWFICRYILTSGFEDSGLLVPARTFTDSRHGIVETWIYAGLSISGSCRVSVSGRISTSGVAAELRPPRVRDLRTMEEVDSTRLTSLEHVITGVGSVSRAAHREADSHGRCCDPPIEL